MNLRLEFKITKAQKKILHEFFEYGPNLQYGINKKLKSEHERLIHDKDFTHRHGKSYNKNLDTLVQLRLLQHVEYHKDPKRRYPINGEIGESLYHLTIWGIILHLRNENKIAPFQTYITDSEINNITQSKVEITDEDLDKIIRHLMDFPLPSPDIIKRKWTYLWENNGEVAYTKLFDTLLFTNRYFDWLNADFIRFENSALKDILLHFLLPYGLEKSYVSGWIKSIVKDTEIFNIITEYLSELKEHHRLNQEIINEYSRILKQKVKDDEKYRTPKFYRKTNSKTETVKQPDGTFVTLKTKSYNSFIIDLPRISGPKRKTDQLPAYYRHKTYIGNGPWGYHLSYFLNELDSGPIRYTFASSRVHRNYRRKRKSINTKLHSSKPE